MKIVMFGVKMVPYPAGAERVAEELGSRLASRGHEVVVYVRKHLNPHGLKEHRGMRLVTLPSLQGKNTETISHSFLASWACLAEKPDLIHIHSTGSSVFSLLPRLFGIPTLVQSHGLDWQRAKWGILAKSYLKMTDYTTVNFPSVATAVSQKMQRYYQRISSRPVRYIPNGVLPVSHLPASQIQKLGLNGNDYILFAARLVPEKGCHYLIEAFQSIPNSGKKLVIAGDGKHDRQYSQNLLKAESETIKFVGLVEGTLLQELLGNAYVYVLPSEIEGLSLGLLEAMSHGNCVLVSDIEENLEAIGDAGMTFRSMSSADMADKLRNLLSDPTLVQEYRARASQNVQEKYNWDKVTEEYENLYQSLQ